MLSGRKPCSWWKVLLRQEEKKPCSWVESAVVGRREEALQLGKVPWWAKRGNPSTGWRVLWSEEERKPCSWVESAVVGRREETLQLGVEG